jgi:hypothetical protein
MLRFAFKALFTMLSLNRAARKRPHWDRLILIFSTTVTIGLVALYAYGKVTARW